MYGIAVTGETLIASADIVGVESIPIVGTWSSDFKKPNTLKLLQFCLYFVNKASVLRGEDHTGVRFAVVLLKFVIILSALFADVPMEIFDVIEGSPGPSHSL
jgi:hypothetical protein